MNASSVYSHTHPPPSLTSPLTYGQRKIAAFVRYFQCVQQNTTKCSWFIRETKIARCAKYKEHFALVSYPAGWNSQPRDERIVLWWPNMNTNIIRFPKNDQIRIPILFGFPKMTQYEYEYYLATQKWPNTNMNIILLPNNDRILGFPKMIEYYIQVQTLLSFPKGKPPRPVLSVTRWC